MLANNIQTIRINSWIATNGYDMGAYTDEQLSEITGFSVESINVSEYEWNDDFFPNCITRWIEKGRILTHCVRSN